MGACFFSPPILSFTEIATSISELHQAHAHMLKTGLFHHSFAASRLIVFAANYPHTDTVSYARSVFNRIDDPNSFAWNGIIRAYANSSDPENAVVMFREMVEGPVVPDSYSYTFALKGCAGFDGVEEGRQIHGRILKIGAGCDAFIQNTLIRMYSANGCFDIARGLLDEMPERDVISWNSLLSGYVDRGSMQLARSLFDEMDERNVESWNFMISGYVGVGLLEEARGVFKEMPVKNVNSWNAIIAGYAHASHFREVLMLFEDMKNAKVKPDNSTLVNVLSACAAIGVLSHGEFVHAYIDQNGIHIDGFLAAALFNMYLKCGNIEKAQKVFRDCSGKDISTWNSLIEGLSTHGLAEHPLFGSLLLVLAGITVMSNWQSMLPGSFWS